ncbi:MAG: hypothetical protein WAK01_08890 [Methylocystis sp.]
MPQVLKRAAADRAAELRSEPSPQAAAATLREARALGPRARVEPRSPVLRPINLERRARFARIQEDEAPYDA